MTLVLGTPGVAPPPNTRVSEHPLMAHAMGHLRDVHTSHDMFRDIMRHLAPLMLYEALSELDTEEITIQTPVDEAVAKQLSVGAIMTVNILGAGAALQPWFSDLPLPHITIQHGFLAMRRNEETLKATTYYARLPEQIEADLSVVCEPMNATGGSTCDAVAELKKRGATNILCVHAVTARPGAERMLRKHPDVPLWTAAFDQKLTDKGFIDPGLGDFGDRWNGC